MPDSGAPAHSRVDGSGCRTHCAGWIVPSSSAPFSPPRPITALASSTALPPHAGPRARHPRSARALPNHRHHVRASPTTPATRVSCRIAARTTATDAQNAHGKTTLRSPGLATGTGVRLARTAACARGIHVWVATSACTQAMSRKESGAKWFTGALSVGRVPPRPVVESSVLSMGLVRFQVGGRWTPECGPETCR